MVGSSSTPAPEESELPIPSEQSSDTESSILDLSTPPEDGGQIGTTPEPTPEPASEPQPEASQPSAEEPIPEPQPEADQPSAETPP